MSDKVKEFWENMASEHNASELATAPDRHYRSLEIDRIAAKLCDKCTILDVGCGNGYSTLKFAEAFPNSEFLGVDYAAEMIKYANQARAKRGLKNASFVEGNVLKLGNAVDGRKFDYVVSERCIINLGDWEQQKSAILGMKAVLKPGGQLVLVENTQEGLANLNGLRAQFGLHDIKIRWHNFYIPQRSLDALVADEFDLVSCENIGNLYYIISRVVYAKLAQMEGHEPRYEHPINEIASRLPSLEQYNFSPNFMWVLKSKT